jgi:hypothetical protein
MPYGIICAYLKLISEKYRGIKMAQQLKKNTIAPSENDSGSLALGVGLAVASMILVPALATRLGLGSSLTGALRIALMKASGKATFGERDDSGIAASGFSCH